MIAWGLETLVASTLLMLVVLVLRGPVRRVVGPGLAYGLWLLPVLRLALPPVPAEWHGQAVPVATGHVLVDYVIEPLSTPVAGAAAIDWFPWIFAGWALGALGFLAYHLIAHSRFCMRLRRQSKPSRMVANGRVHLIESDATQGPLAFGIWRKYVAFPQDFRERYDAVERDLALAHELGHHARGDLIANWVALIVLAIHWFNPIAWRAFRAFRADQEMACDALVLSGRALALRHAYGRAIVKSAHGGAVSAACHMHTINDVKGRLRMLSISRPATRTQFLAGVAALGGLAIGSLALTASGSQAAEKMRDNVEKTVGVELASLDPIPQVPASPLPPAPPQLGKVPVPPSTVAPPAPPARAAERSESGAKVVEWTDKDGRRHVVRTIRRPGTSLTDTQRADMRERFRNGDFSFDMPDMDVVLNHMPDVTSGRCGVDGPDRYRTVQRTKDGEKRKIMICTDRIELSAKQGQAMGERFADLGKMQAQFAMRNALTSLRMARRSVEAQQSLSETQRREALAGIDQAVRELEKDAADNKD